MYRKTKREKKQRPGGETPTKTKASAVDFIIACMYAIGEPTR
jgi:hypothetical protein